MAILKGKLIKKNQIKNQKKIEVSEFPWLDFKEKNIVFPDNPRHSLILKKYHDPEEMRLRIKDSAQFSQLLEKKTTPLYPVDLSVDYDRGVSELIKRKRRRMMGEEEAMALELAEFDSTHAVQFKSKFETQMENTLLKQETTQPQPEQKDAPLSQSPLSTPMGDHELNLKEQFKQEDVSQNEDIQKENEPTLEIKEKEKQDHQEDEQDEKKALAEGYENGYLEGYKSGEERGMLAQESKYEDVFKNVARVVQQIEKLKDSLYEESKEVFVEILKLCAEKILREQLKFSDHSLFALFDEVRKSISEKSTLKIELNAEDMVRMQKYVQDLGIEDRVTLKEDVNKHSGDFTVETEQGISVVNMEKSIENLMEKIKTELFSDEELKSKGA